MTLSIFFHLQPSCPSGSASVLARNQETPTLPMMYVPNHSISFQFDPNDSLLFQSNPKKFHLITGWGWWCRACPCWWLRRGRGRRRGGRGKFYFQNKTFYPNYLFQYHFNCSKEEVNFKKSKPIDARKETRFHNWLYLFESTVQTKFS